MKRDAVKVSQRLGTELVAIGNAYVDRSVALMRGLAPTYEALKSYPSARFFELLTRTLPIMESLVTKPTALSIVIAATKRFDSYTPEEMRGLYLAAVDEEARQSERNVVLDLATLWHDCTALRPSTSPASKSKPAGLFQGYVAAVFAAAGQEISPRTIREHMRKDS